MNFKRDNKEFYFVINLNLFIFYKKNKLFYIN